MRGNYDPGDLYQRSFIEGAGLYKKLAGAG